MQSGTTIKITKRDARLALSALETLSKGRGFPDAATAVRVGRTIRRLRQVTEEADDARKALIQSHAKKDDDGKMVETAGTGVVLESPRQFVDALHQLDQERHDVEVWPISASVLGDDVKANRCSRCKQLTGLPDAEEFAMLLDLGIVLEQTT